MRTAAALSTAALVSVVLVAAPAADAQDRRAAHVVAADIRPLGGDAFRVDANIRSDDAGWDAYADRFEVLAPDGRVLGVRELLHPHVDEQPFTRSLPRVEIPAGVAEVRVRAHFRPDGHGGREAVLAVPGR